MECERLLRRDGHRDGDGQIVGANGHPEYDVHCYPLRMDDGIAALLYCADVHERRLLPISERKSRTPAIIHLNFRFSRAAENNVVSGRSGFRFNARHNTVLGFIPLIAEVQAQ